jgi:Endodeoxyribonuclease RusA
MISEFYHVRSTHKLFLRVALLVAIVSTLTGTCFISVVSINAYSYYSQFGDHLHQYKLQQQQRSLQQNYRQQLPQLYHDKQKDKLLRQCRRNIEVTVDVDTKLFAVTKNAAEDINIIIKNEESMTKKEKKTKKSVARITERTDITDDTDALLNKKRRASPSTVAKAKRSPTSKSSKKAPKSSQNKRTTFEKPSHWIVSTDEVAYTEISIPVMDVAAPTASPKEPRIVSKRKRKSDTSDDERMTNDSTNITSDEINATLMIPSISQLPHRTVPSLFRCTIRGNPLPLRRHRTTRGFMYNPSSTSQLVFRTLVQQLLIAVTTGGAPICRRSSSNSSNFMSTTGIVIDGIMSGNVTPQTILPILVDDSDDDGMLFVPRASDGRPMFPLWDIEHPIAVSIVFRMKRPNSHFIGNKPFVAAKACDIDDNDSDDPQTRSDHDDTKQVATTKSRLRTTAPTDICTTAIRTDVDNLAKYVLDSLNNVTYADDKQVVSLHVMKLYDNDVQNLYQGSTTVTLRLVQHHDDMNNFP